MTEIPALSPAEREQLLALIAESGYRRVHYTGSAEVGLLRALLAVDPPLEVSVMDMDDRWERGFAYFWEEDEFPGIPCPEKPEWLGGVSFYQEGAPDHEIGLRYWPWDSCDQLERIVAFTGRKASTLLILFGDADKNFVGVSGIFEDGGEWETRYKLCPAPFRHPSYDWETPGGLKIGRWKHGIESAFERRQRKRDARSKCE